MISLETARKFLFGRSGSYLRVFTGNQDADFVLSDLARFCRFFETTFHPDPRVSAMLDGRREVFLRIAEHLKLNDEELWKLYGNRQLKGIKDE